MFYHIIDKMTAFLLLYLGLRAGMAKDYPSVLLFAILFGINATISTEKN